jgi:hypothetical protein
MECPICGIVPNDPYPFEPHTDTCDHAVSFVRDITVAQVIQAVEDLMSVFNLPQPATFTGVQEETILQSEESLDAAEYK